MTIFSFSKYKFNFSLSKAAISEFLISNLIVLLASTLFNCSVLPLGHKTFTDSIISSLPIQNLNMLKQKTENL